METPIILAERDMTEVERQLELAGFDAYGGEHDNPPEGPTRYGFVVSDGDTFVGCSSGLAHTNGREYNGWFYLSDLYVVKAYRGRGYGSALLSELKSRVVALGVHTVWTWTAGFEAPELYRKHGYEVFARFERWYATGNARVGMKKGLQHPGH